jgi:polyribonucleotide nucleotidyltransferase
MVYSKLELERTINSMSLAAEREILKKIHKLNLLRRQISEKKQQDDQIKQHKVAVTNLRDTLKVKRADISEMKVELSTVQTAVALGCEVKDLLGKKIDCPTDKIGSIIGKKGKNVQEIMATNNVDVQIGKDQGDIRLIGSSLESLDSVVARLEHAMTQTEKHVEISSSLYQYLTNGSITLLTQLRSRHPDAHIDMKSIKLDDIEKAKDRIRNVRIRGNPADIAALEQDLINIECITREIFISSRTSGLLVGKAGKNIDDLVKHHQVVIDVHRSTTKENAAKDVIVADESVKVTVRGPPTNVEAVLTIINNAVEENRDYEVSIPLDSIVRVVLLSNSGTGIQALQKLANEESKAHVQGTTSSSILLNVKGNDLVVKGKAKAVNYIMPFVNKEIEQIQSRTIKMNIDTLVIPVLIGKGGQGIKELLNGTSSVHIDIHTKDGEIEICGLVQSEVDKVVQATKSVIQNNQVQRLRLECDDTSSTNSFAVQFRNLIRSTFMKQIKELVVLVADDDAKEIALRGSQDNLMQASKLVQEFLDTNFMEELVVSTEDMSALLTGGKVSKIVDLTKSTGVNLSADKERNVVVAKGEKTKVVHSIQAVREFLYGSSNVAVLNIAVPHDDLMGVVIGKAGKTKADLQKKYPSVSIIVHRTDAAVTLRGDNHQVEQCHDDIMSLLFSANVTRTVKLTDENIIDSNSIKYIRRLGPLASVKVEVNTESKDVSFRGTRSDVHIAMALLKEYLAGMYESQWFLGATFFKKIYDVCSKSMQLNRIAEKSGAKIYLDEKYEVIVFSGTRETVKAAKKEIVSLFDFVLGASILKIDIPVAAFPMMGKSMFIHDVVAKTGTTIVADQDLSMILILSSKSEKLNEASVIINVKLEAVEKLIFVWQFNESEEWLVSLVIGKKGESIQKLRNETNCTIEVDSKERRMVVSAEDVNVVQIGKEIIDTFVSKARKECAIVNLSPLDTPAFIGKSGKNMKTFMERNNVKLELGKKGEDSTIRITGDEDQVASAKQAIIEWVANRVEVRKDAEGEILKHVRLKDIPVVIGKKGETIRRLEKEFGCKAKIDREALTITVIGGSSRKRLAFSEKIDDIIVENDDAKKIGNDREIEYLGEAVELSDETINNLLLD